MTFRADIDIAATYAILSMKGVSTSPAMKARLFFVLSLVVALSVGLGGGLSAALSRPAAPPVPNRADIAASLHNAPLMFIENVGQFDPRARFQVRGGNGALWLAEDALWITLLERPQREEHPARRGLRDLGGLPTDDQPRRGVNLKLSFVGANPHPRLEPFHRLETHVSYFIGNDPTKWYADVPVWSGVRYVDLYPGIDLELSGEGGRWQPRILARSGVDLSQVRLRVQGADSVTVEGDRLLLNTAVAAFSLPSLLTGEGTSLQPTVVNDTITFVSHPFHPVPESVDSPAVASPSNRPANLIYSLRFGGNDIDAGKGIAVDASGAAYVTGLTWSLNFPVTPGVFQQYNGGGLCSDPPIPCPDAFVAKLNPNGSGLAYSTFLGGSAADFGLSIAIDVSGAAYVTGYTYASNFPITSGAFQPACASCPYTEDTFITKLNATGSALVYSTFLGGGSADGGNAIALDASGAAYVTGTTFSSNFPVTPGAFQQQPAGDYDAFVAKLNASGSGLVYSTYLGAMYWDIGYGIAVDTSGAAYVTGDTLSPDFPTTPGAFQTTYGGGQCGLSPDTFPCPDGFVTKLNADGSNLAYSTFLGGSNTEAGYGISLDANGQAYITGTTHSIDFPVTSGAFQTTLYGGGDAFITKLNTTGSGLVYSTFLGGDGWDPAFGIALDGSGGAYITGWTTSSDFPTTPGAFQTTYGGFYDAFVTKLNAAGTGLDYSTYLGGSGMDSGEGIALDLWGIAYVTGDTSSSDFPTTIGAFPPGSYPTRCEPWDPLCSDVFVAAFDIGLHLSNHVSLPLILNRR